MRDAQAAGRESRQAVVESGVELDLAGIEIATGESFERHGVDALNTDVAQIGDGRTLGEKVGQTGRDEGVGAGAGAVDRNRWDTPGHAQVGSVAPCARHPHPRTATGNTRLVPTIGI